MSGGALVIRTLEDLKAFQNKEGVMEIAVRNATAPSMDGFASDSAPITHNNGWTNS